MKKVIGTLLDQKPRAQGAWITLIFFVLMTFVTVLSWKMGWQENLSASYETAFLKKEWWRLPISVFLHADPEHWLSNSLLLVIFGSLLAGHFGFWVFPVASLILAWITHGMALYTYPKEIYLIGASGLVYVQAGLWLSLYFFLSINRTVRGRILRVLGLILALLLPTQFQPQVSYRVHLIGFIMGFLYGVFYYFKNRSQLRQQDQVLEEFDEDR